MRFERKMAIGLGVLLIAAQGAFAADDLKSVLAQLNAAAARFHSASASLEQVNEMTEPIPDKDTLNGTIYTEHKGQSVELGIHYDKENGKPIPKIIVIKGGVFSMYDKLPNQLTTSNKAGKLEKYLSLGFGGSGDSLEANWKITYGGSETMDGVKVARLDLVPKDPEALKIFQKVTMWIEPERGICRKQYFDQGQGQSRTVVYSNIKVNESLPGDAFSIKTDSKTQVIAR